MISILPTKFEKVILVLCTRYYSFSKKKKKGITLTWLIPLSIDFPAYPIRFGAG